MEAILNGTVLRYHQSKTRNGYEYAFIDFYSNCGDSARLFLPESLWTKFSVMKRFQPVSAVCDVRLRMGKNDEYSIAYSVKSLVE